MAVPSKNFTVQADSSIDADSPWNESRTTELRDNDVHLEEWMGKDYVAAQNHDHDGVNSAALNLTSLVGQGELKTSSGIVSTTGTANLTLPGGTFGLYPQIKSSTGGLSFNIGGAFAGASYTTNIYIVAGSSTGYAQQTYITASAPFNLGNGDIPLFVFALIDNTTGDVVATYSSDTPPWFYNGRPENTFNAKKYKKKKGKANHFYDRIVMPDKVVDFTSYLDALENPQNYIEEIEITPAMKNLDMDIIPHPFMGNDLTGKSVVLIDPVGSMAEKMRDLHDMGESVADLLHDGYLLIDNEDVGANSPVGVKTHKVKWK